MRWIIIPLIAVLTVPWVAATKRDRGTVPTSPLDTPASRPPATADRPDPGPIGVAMAPRLPSPVAVVDPVLQNFEYYPYDASWTFIRIQTAGGYGGFGGRRRRGFGGGPGWLHDYPDADRNFSKILNEITYVHTRLADYGGNVLTFDDPRLMQFPAAYVSEPGQWTVTQEEADGLREYLSKGGFVIFDDFGGYRDPYDMYNLAEQMKRVLPELDFMRLERDADVFDSFFEIDPDNLLLAAEAYRGYPEFWGIFEDNDPEKRLMVIAGDRGDFGEFWEYSDRGFYTIDLSNEAYKIGVNYVIYALTH